MQRLDMRVFPEAQIAAVYVLYALFATQPSKPVSQIYVSPTHREGLHQTIQVRLMLRSGLSRTHSHTIAFASLARITLSMVFLAVPRVTTQRQATLRRHQSAARCHATRTLTSPSTGSAGRKACVRVVVCR